MADKFADREIFTLTDEQGVEQKFELIDSMTVDEEFYYALVPYYDDPTKELEADTELVILKSQVDENDEESMVSIDNDEEYEKIGNMFLDRLNEEYDDDESN